MAVERFYIIKGGQREGPFDESYVRFLLENEEVGFDDFCEDEAGERFRLGALYEPADEDQGEADETAANERGPKGKPPQPRPPRRVLYVGHPSFLKFRLSWLLVAGGSAGGYLLGPQSVVAMLTGFGLALAAMIYMVIGRSSHQYVITSRRIEAIHGLVAKDSQEIRVEDIRTINVKRSGILGVLGVGTVEFSSTGDAIDVQFVDVWAARRIKGLVRRLQDTLEVGG